MRLSQRLCRSTMSCLFQVPETTGRVSQLWAAQVELPAVSLVRAMRLQTFKRGSLLEVGRFRDLLLKINCGTSGLYNLFLFDSYFGKLSTNTHLLSISCCFDICMMPLKDRHMQWYHFVTFA